MLEISDRILFDGVDDILSLIPPGLPDEFTTQELARLLSEPRWLAQKTAYCLNKMGLIEQVGKRNRSKLYRYQ